MSATAGLKEALYALGVRQGDTGLDPAVLRVVSDGSQIAGATLGAWIAVAIGGVATAVFRNGNPIRWYGPLCVVVVVLGVLSVIDIVSTATGGIFAMLGFMGSIIWMPTSSVIMVRRSLLP